MKKLYFICFGLLAVIGMHAQNDSELRKLGIAEMAIKSLYVEEVDETKLVEDAIRGMIEKLGIVA